MGIGEVSENGWVCFGYCWFGIRGTLLTKWNYSEAIRILLNRGELILGSQQRHITAPQGLGRRRTLSSSFWPLVRVLHMRREP
jgi:hypothetical protein